MRQLRIEDLDDLATGAAVLGTGGGGNPYRGKLMAELAMRETGPVTVLEPEELDDDALVIPVWNIGAPVCSMERIHKGDEGLRALRALEKFLGREAAAVSPVEVGGSNSTLPLRVAAQTGLPVVDCDGMGRAYPEVHMVTATLFGVPVTPGTIVDAAGNCVYLETADHEQAERLARVVCVQMGGTASMAAFSMTARQLREAMIPGTLQLAQRIGSAIRQARRSHTDPVEAILEITGGLRLFEGKIVDLERRVSRGWAKGHYDVQGKDEVLRVDFQNEFLIARTLAGQVLCTVPDLITALDTQTGEPITTENLRYGYRVTVLGIPCDRRWRTPEGIALGGPGHFGYEYPYVPVEEQRKMESTS